jgi:hypothetical protein
VLDFITADFMEKKSPASRKKICPRKKIQKMIATLDQPSKMPKNALATYK